MTTVADLNFVTVHGTYIDMTGAPIAGTVTFSPSSRVLDAGSDKIILPAQFSASLDSSGHFTATIPATDDPDVTPGFSYFFTENIPGGQSFTIGVPIAYLSSGVSIITLLETTGGGIAGADTTALVSLTQFNALAATVAGLSGSSGIDGGSL